MLFHLTTDDHIGIINEQGPAEAHSEGTTFASEQHFHELAKEWPMKRLVAIWNRLPEVEAVARSPIARPRLHGSGEPFSRQQKQIVRLRHPIQKRNSGGSSFAKVRKRHRSTLCCAGRKAPP